MALELVGGILLEGVVSQLSELIADALKKSYHFNTELKNMQETIERIRPSCNALDELNNEADGPKEELERLMNLLRQAEDLVRNCRSIKWNAFKKYKRASRFEEINESLEKFVRVDLQFLMARKGYESATAIKKMEKLLEQVISSGVSLTDLKDKVDRNDSTPLMEMHILEMELEKGFDDRFEDVKAMVLKDSPDGDCAVAVVSAAGGYGKSYLVKKLCEDPDIKGEFERNIYWATISEKYDVKYIIKSLLGRYQECDFSSDEDAILQWKNYLGQNKSKTLLVLDDVWSSSIIMKLKFKSPGYKILVTSRITFKQFNTYHLLPLNDHDATSLFRRSAFSEHGKNSYIPDDLVDKLIKCCKNHPLALTVVGSWLNGKHMASWLDLLMDLSNGKKSILNVHPSVELALEHSVYFLQDMPKVKNCYLDLGLFPEDQKIAATTLMDMWAHLYNHDDDGSYTMDILSKLSSRNLATLLAKRRQLSAIANHCEEEYVKQDKLMRELAIHLASQEPIEHRERLITSSKGEYHLQLSQTVNARILSISTDEEFSITALNEIKAPKVAVFVMNFMAIMNPLLDILVLLD